MLDDDDAVEFRLNRRRAGLAGAVILALGLACTIANRDLPIARNSFVYAKVCEHIVEHGYNPLPIIADINLSYGKPVLFSFVSAPLVQVFGVNTGLKLASFLGSALLLGVALPFFGIMNRRLGVSDRYLPIELGILFLNPLVFYQFWSAYPDSLFAAQVLLAFVLTDRIVESTDRRSKGLIVLLGLVIYATILTKLYGLMLGLLCPVYLLQHWRSLLAPDGRFGTKIRWLVGVFGLLGLLVLLAKAGQNPSIDLGTRGSNPEFSVGVSELGAGLADPSVSDATTVFGAIAFTFLLSFHVALFFLVRRGGLAAWPLAATCFAGLFLLGYLPFGKDAAYNIRYFLPVLSFAVVPIVSGIQAMKRGLLKGVLLVVYASGTLLLTLNYNVRPVYEGLRAANVYARPFLNKDDRLHSLRLPRHIELQNMVDLLNRVVEPGGELYWISAYYDTATHGVIQELGIRRDIQVSCVTEASDIPTAPAERPFHVAQHFARFAAEDERLLGERFVVSPIGFGVARVSPPMWLVSPERNARFEPGQLVPFRATVEPSARRVLQVEFLVDGRGVGADDAPPYEGSWTPPSAGVYRLAATARREDGGSDESPARALFVGLQGFERHVARPADDAEELLRDGSVGLTSSDLELITDDGRDAGGQLVGVRFSEVAIPQGARVRRAHLEFAEYNYSSGVTELTIRAQLAADAATFAKRHHDLSSRPRTQGSVTWRPADWEGRSGWLQHQRTPDIAALVEEVVALPEWRAGNAIVFLITGTGRRVAYSADGARELGAVPSFHAELGDGRDAAPAADSPDAELGSHSSDRSRLVGSTLDGGELYRTYCALCHGRDGEGYKADFANALANPEFLSVATDGFLRRAIADGRPGTPMSAWSHRRGGPLSDQQISEIVAYIRELGLRPTTSTPSVTGVSPESPAETFRMLCAECHGAAGDGKAAVSLNNPNFLASASDDYLRRSIEDGRRRTPMPAFAGQLSSATIDGLVGLIRSWQRPVAAVTEVAAPILGSLGELVSNPSGGAPTFELRDRLYASVADVAAALAAGKRMVIVDARATSDWQVDHIVGAVPMPFYSIDYEAHALPNDGTWVIAYCACPHAASGTVIEEFRRRGFPNTAVLDEGYDVWVEQGHPTQRGADRLIK